MRSSDSPLIRIGLRIMTASLIVVGVVLLLEVLNYRLLNEHGLAVMALCGASFLAGRYGVRR